MLNIQTVVVGKPITLIISGCGAGGYVHVEYIKTVKPVATVLTVTGFSAGVGVAYVVSEIDTLRSEMIQIKNQPKTNKEDNDITIYRYGGTNPGNMKPSNNDYQNNSPLSFSTIPQGNSWKTTIEKINATGVLREVKDNEYHVSVYPIGGTIKQWREQGVDSVWTQALLSVCVKVKWD